MDIDLGLIEGVFFLIGCLIGVQLENIKRFEYKNWKTIFAVLVVVGGGTTVSYFLDNVFNLASFSLIVFWIGLIFGYYGSLCYKEIGKSRLALIKGFAAAKPPKS